MENALLLRDVTFKDKETTIIYNGCILEQECDFLQHPSGSGKSTLFHILVGLETATKGSVVWKGVHLPALPPQQRQIAILYQDCRLFPHLSVWQNIALGWSGDGHLDFRQRHVSQAMMQSLDILHLSKQAAGLCSGGEQKRVALIRALAKARRFVKPLLLLDEPFAGLDHTNQEKALNLIQEEYEEQKLTMLIASHQKVGDMRHLNRKASQAPITIEYKA